MSYFKTLSDQPFIAQLQQLTNLTWDGDLISKSERDKLLKAGLIIKRNGWQVISEKGIDYLSNGGFINA